VLVEHMGVPYVRWAVAMDLGTGEGPGRRRSAVRRRPIEIDAVLLRARGRSIQCLRKWSGRSTLSEPYQGPSVRRAKRKDLAQAAVI
jgi:hypothetical protein